jgi:hypothetical protein
MKNKYLLPLIISPVAIMLWVLIVEVVVIFHPQSESKPIKLVSLTDSELQSLYKINMGLSGIVKYESCDIHFEPTHVTQKDTTKSYSYSSLMEAEHLIRNCKKTPESEIQLIGYILDYINFENSTFFPQSYAMEDHPVTSRVSVIIQALYYTNKYDENQLKTITNTLDKYLKLLTNKHYYAYHSNHGMIQNIAVFMLATYFDGLVEKDELLDIISRFNQHLSYYISAEGVVLEHSPEYQYAGILFLQNAIQVMNSNRKIKTPEQWHKKIVQAKAVMEVMLREDYSLPTISDTNNTKYSKEQFKVSNRSQFFPKSGFLFAFQEPDKKLAVTWSHYKGFAHRKSNDFSFSYWEGGDEIISNVGYWPFGHPLRNQSNTTYSSNTPHFVGETHITKPIAKLSSNGSNYVSMQRSSLFGEVTRTISFTEQKLEWKDTFSSKENQTAEIILTIGQGSLLTEISSYQYLLKSRNEEKRLTITSNAELHVEIKTALKDSIIGWASVGRKIVPANVLVITSKVSANIPTTITTKLDNANSNLTDMTPIKTSEADISYQDTPMDSNAVTSYQKMSESYTHTQTNMKRRWQISYLVLGYISLSLLLFYIIKNRRLKVSLSVFNLILTITLLVFWRTYITK